MGYKGLTFNFNLHNKFIRNRLQDQAEMHIHLSSLSLETICQLRRNFYCILKTQKGDSK